MTTSERLVTAGELLDRGTDTRCELIRGVVYDRPYELAAHGLVAANLALVLGRFVADHDLGRTLIADAGFILERNPDTVVACDIAFVSNRQLTDIPHCSFFPAPPALAVEVITDSGNVEISIRIKRWLRAGTACVWHVDTASKCATVSRLKSGLVNTEFVDVLSFESLFPGFELPLSELWD
jgi:Uma2 family endonuclease